jgi:hypothetical protein
MRVYERRIAGDERDFENGIPVTTVARTILDLASVLDRERLHQAVSKAEARGLSDAVALPELLERHRGKRGVAVLRRIIGDTRLGLDVTRSELEIEFQAFLGGRGFERPEINAVVEVAGRRLEVDCLWRDQRVIVEVDSRTHHLDATAFESDRARDRALTAAGWVPLRVTAKSLRRHSAAVAAELRAALDGRAATLPPQR